MMTVLFLIAPGLNTCPFPPGTSTLAVGLEFIVTMQIVFTVNAGSVLKLYRLNLNLS